MAEDFGHKTITYKISKPNNAIIPVSMHKDDKTPFLGDPIHLLVDLYKKLSNKKLKPVIGIELEFYLLRKKFLQ